MQPSILQLDIDSTYIPNRRTGALTIYSTLHNQLYVFGGIAYSSTNPFGEYMNDLWVYDLSSNQWRELNSGDYQQGETAVPLPRVWSSMIFTDASENQLLFYGGNTVLDPSVPEDTGSGYDNGELWLYDISSDIWSQPAQARYTCQQNITVCTDSIDLTTRFNSSLLTLQSQLNNILGTSHRPADVSNALVTAYDLANATLLSAIHQWNSNTTQQLNNNSTCSVRCAPGQYTRDINSTHVWPRILEGHRMVRYNNTAYLFGGSSCQIGALAGM